MSLQDFLNTYYNKTTELTEEEESPQSETVPEAKTVPNRPVQPRPRPTRIKTSKKVLKQIEPPKRRITKKKSVPIDLSRVKVEESDMMDEDE